MTFSSRRQLFSTNQLQTYNQEINESVAILSVDDDFDRVVCLNSNDLNHSEFLRDVGTQTDIPEVSNKEVTVIMLPNPIAQRFEEDGSYLQFGAHINNKVYIMFRGQLEAYHKYLMIQGTLEDRITIAIAMLNKYSVYALPDEEVNPDLLRRASREIWEVVKPFTVNHHPLCDMRRHPHLPMRGFINC